MTPALIERGIHSASILSLCNFRGSAVQLFPFSQSETQRHSAKCPNIIKISSQRLPQRTPRLRVPLQSNLHVRTQNRNTHTPMKTKLTLALMAILTSSAFAAIPSVLPEFKNEQQLAQWRNEMAAKHASTSTTNDEQAFYTGKPYIAAANSYAFKYRSYNPEVARWTSEDPSGFPDGANNILYVNNMSMNCLDRMGLDIWQITNSNSVAGGGHTAMISGSGSDYQLQSYGIGSSGSASSGSNGLTTQNYTSSQAALDAAASQGYDGYNRWDTTNEQDSAARNGFATNANGSDYHVGTHNCADALHAGLEAAGVSHDSTTNIPNRSHTLNKLYADSSSKLTPRE